MRSGEIKDFIKKLEQKRDFLISKSQCLRVAIESLERVLERAKEDEQEEETEGSGD